MDFRVTITEFCIQLVRQHKKAAFCPKSVISTQVDFWLHYTMMKTVAPSR